MIKDIDKRKVAYAKGQWRFRVLRHIQKMIPLIEAAHDSESIKQRLIFYNSRLTRMGYKGEAHLEKLEELDFTSLSILDLRMVLLMIACFSILITRITLVNTAGYKPTDPGIWQQEKNYEEWSTKTRRQWKSFAATIKEINKGVNDGK